MFRNYLVHHFQIRCTGSMACFCSFIQIKQIYTAKRAESNFFSALLPYHTAGKYASNLLLLKAILQMLRISPVWRIRHLLRRHQNRCRDVKNDSDVQKSKYDKHKPYHCRVHPQIFSDSSAYAADFAVMIRSA